jgi:hypothetical protein
MHGGRVEAFRRASAAALGRRARASALDDRQRAWLIEDLKVTLGELTEEAEGGAVSGQTAARMATIRATILWLQGRGASPGAVAVAYLEEGLRSICRPDLFLWRNPFLRLKYRARTPCAWLPPCIQTATEWELFRRGACLAAIGELGGDVEAASRIWRPSTDPGDPAGRGKALARQGRKLRSLMWERGMSIGELADRSGIDDLVLLISFLFGLEEMRFEEAMRLAGALRVSPARFSEGIRFEGGGVRCGCGRVGAAWSSGAGRLPEDRSPGSEVTPQV